MAQIESILGDQPESSQPSQTKQNNVTEFNKQPAKNDASSFATGNSPRGGTGDGRSGAATATARSLYDQAKETAGQAYEAVTDKAATKLDEQKSTLSGGLTTVADSVRQVSQNLGSSKTDSGLAEAAAKYTSTAAQKLEDVAGYFETRGVRDMARDLEGFARKNPAVFFGAAFGVGFLVARFLKSSTPRYDNPAGREFGTFATDAGHQLPAASTTGEKSTEASKRV
jgi:ElaB/YqjD/DUF883 family membrane-anchored ribosome-binding protein